MVAKKSASKSVQPLVLFDVDGVIIDSFTCLYDAISSYVKDQRGEILTVEEFRGLFMGNALATLMQRLGHESYDQTRSFVHMSKMLFHGYKNAPVFAGMDSVLAAIAKKCTMVVVTSSPSDIVQLRFSDAGLDRYFAAYMGPEAGVKKDDKIAMAIKEFGQKGAPVYFVTDTTGDIVEAKKTVVKTIAATWGYHDEETLRAAAPDYLARAPQDLLTILFP